MRDGAITVRYVKCLKPCGKPANESVLKCRGCFKNRSTSRFFKNCRICLRCRVCIDTLRRAARRYGYLNDVEISTHNGVLISLKEYRRLVGDPACEVILPTCDLVAGSPNKWMKNIDVAMVVFIRDLEKDTTTLRYVQRGKRAMRA